MLMFKNEDLPGLSLLLDEHAVKFRLAVSRGLLRHPSTVCCSGLRNTLI